MTPAERWVDEVARTTRPERVVWCDGSEEEGRRLVDGMVADGTLLRLHPTAAPGSTLHRSHPSDVARTEHLTFIASRDKRDAGPTNNWMAPSEARARVGPLFEGVMKGRTMYVVPYVMGPLGSPFSRVGIEVTDSPYVAANMRLRPRMGGPARRQLGASESFVPGLHSTGDLSPERRYIVHFPEERLTWSVGSGYGGNALLGKKCFALRIAGAMARDEGWMAEHMPILRLELPGAEIHYIAAAFPSACGKTNLAMMVSPFERVGYKVRTVGDDIAWLRPGADGRLWAVNPEAGFFGVVPGTGPDTNPNAMATISHDTIFTNVAVTSDGIPWWEGKEKSEALGWEPTAAATGQAGVVRRDPLAMLPFCGYNMGAYFAHWLKMGRTLSRPPRIFHVNWFRTGHDGRFIWPGFGENLRVLMWMIDRVKGVAAGADAPIGVVPTPDALNVDGLGLGRGDLERLLTVDRDEWAAEVPEMRAFFDRFGDRLPPEL